MAARMVDQKTCSTTGLIGCGFSSGKSRSVGAD